MKKHLIAAAVAGALAVPAMAQVTISGRIDTSIMAVESNAGADTTQMRSNALTTNQIVISGSEDLGGGLKASFLFSSGMNSDQNTDFNLGNRGMLVGVSGGFGSVMVGKSTSTHANGSVVVGGPLGNLAPVNLAGGMPWSRPNNSITYKTPTMGGVSVQVIHGLGAETDPNTGEQTEVSIAAKVGAVSVSAGFGQINDVSSTDADEISLAAAADLGMAKLSVRYLDLDYDAAAGNDSKGYGVGVSFDLGSGLTAVVDYTDIDTNADTDRSRVAVGLIKALSKRTNVYAAYYSDKEDGAGLEDGSGFGVGVRHAF
jgi:predicted porin